MIQSCSRFLARPFAPALLLTVLGLMALLSQPALANSGDGLGIGPLTLEGHGVTGWNQRFGEPVASLRFVGLMNLDVGGVFNPDGPALPIDQNTSPDALLASYAAPDVYLLFFGVENAENAPNQNIPFADYPQLRTHDSQLGPLLQLADNPEWWGKSNGARIKDYTVARWLEVEGRVTFVCSPSQGNYYELQVDNAVAGGLYTIWGFYFDQEAGQLQPDFAFGGTSANVFTADKDGRIRGARALSFCPQGLDPSERFQLVNLFLVFHPDGRVNAAVGHTVATPPFNGPGMTATPQMMFPMPLD